MPLNNILLVFLSRKWIIGEKLAFSKSASFISKNNLGKFKNTSQLYQNSGLKTKNTKYNLEIPTNPSAG